MKWLLFACKNVLRNRRRALMAMLITAVGTAAVLVGSGFALFTYDSLREVSARDTGHVVLAQHAYFDGDEDMPMQNGLAGATELAASLRALPGTRAVLSRIQFSGLISNGDKSAIFLGAGIEPLVDFQIRGVQTGFVAGEPFAAGAAAPEIVVGKELAKLMKAKVGSSLTLLATTTEGTLNAVDVTVSGIVTVGVPDIDKRLVYADIAAVQKLLLTDKVSTLSVYLRDKDDTDAAAASLAAAHPQLAVRSWLDLAVFYQSVKALYDRIFGMLGIIMLVIVLFAMTNTLGMAVAERTREIGTLRAIGTYPGELVRNFMLEGAAVGGGGALAGMAVAGATTVALMFARLQMPPPPGRSTGYPLLVNFSPALYIAVGVAVIAVSAFAAYLASRKAARRPITEALAHV
ncbi:MAG TPA: FtsX-like permease family protein [Burkholderiales bacterium]|jgi:putative ABC transport system permease protein